MNARKKNQRGEIVTILTLAGLIILGVSTLVSSVFLSKGKPQTTISKASPSDKCGSINAGDTCTLEGDTCYKCTGQLDGCNPADAGVGVPWLCAKDSTGALKWKISNQYGECTTTCWDPNYKPPGSCGKTCGYDQQDADGINCHSGNCSDGSQNCSDDVNCSYVSGCSTGATLHAGPCSTKTTCSAGQCTNNPNKKYNVLDDGKGNKTYFMPSDTSCSSLRISSIDDYCSLAGTNECYTKNCASPSTKVYYEKKVSGVSQGFFTDDKCTSSLADVNGYCGGSGTKKCGDTGTSNQCGSTGGCATGSRCQNTYGSWSCGGDPACPGGTGSSCSNYNGVFTCGNDTANPGKKVYQNQSSGQYTIDQTCQSGWTNTGPPSICGSAPAGPQPPDGYTASQCTDYSDGYCNSTNCASPSQCLLGTQNSLWCCNKTSNPSCNADTCPDGKTNVYKNQSDGYYYQFDCKTLITDTNGAKTKETNVACEDMTATAVNSSCPYSKNCQAIYKSGADNKTVWSNTNTFSDNPANKFYSDQGCANQITGNLYAWCQSASGGQGQAPAKQCSPRACNLIPGVDRNSTGTVWSNVLSDGNTHYYNDNTCSTELTGTDAVNNFCSNAGRSNTAVHHYLKVANQCSKPFTWLSWTPFWYKDWITVNRDIQPGQESDYIDITDGGRFSCQDYGALNYTSPNDPQSTHQQIDHGADCSSAVDTYYIVKISGDTWCN